MESDFIPKATRGRPRKVQPDGPDAILSPETIAAAELILDGIDRARPNDDSRPRTVDAIVALSLGKLRSDVERVFPEYFVEIKPARFERKVA